MSIKARSAEHALATIEIDRDGVLLFRYRDGIYLDEAGARDIVACGASLAGEDAPMPTVVLVSRVKGVSKGARDFFSKSAENWALSSRVAMVVRSPTARMVANFFLGLNKPEHPTRLFNDEASARAWLLQ